MSEHTLEFGSDQDADKCLSAGCSHYITKPIDVATFASQVASSLGAVSYTHLTLPTILRV